MRLARGLGHRQTRDADWLASQGFQLFGKEKSQAGRPRIPENLLKLIVQMAKDNPTWGRASVAAELVGFASGAESRREPRD
jgi:hypothetical protein